MSVVKQLLAFFFFFLCVITAKSQEQFAFRIGFTNKNGSPTVSNPLSFLSQRALDRRTKFSISLEETDRPVSPLHLDSVLTLTQGKLHVTSRWLNECVVLLNDSSKILQLQGKSFISNIQYIAYYINGLHLVTSNDGTISENSFQQKTTADPGYYNNTWGQTNLVLGECLHDLGFKGKGKIIAVLDDGFNYVNSAVGFDSLMAKGNVVDKRNFVLAHDNVYGYGTHGTTVLSTIVGNMPNNYIGAAIDAQIALYITEDNTSEKAIEMDNFLAGLERADSLGADIISSSLGYNYFDAPFPSLSYADIDGKTTIAAKAVNMATQKGILCIISAGNEGGNSWNNILTPGDADSALTIGSVDNSKTVAANSGYGPNSSGVLKPDVCVQGFPAQVLANGPNPYSSNGTSVSTPQVAGYAACMMQAQPLKTPNQVKDAIRKSSHLYNNPDNHAGYGVPNFCNALTILDVEEVNLQNNIEVAPNPCNGAFTISFENHGNKTVEIILHSVDGNEIVHETMKAMEGKNNILISLPENTSSGIYLGEIIAKEGSRSFKILTFR